MSHNHKGTHVRQKAAKPCFAKRKPLAEETIRRIVGKMPNGLAGFCTTWGWLTFARRIEKAHKIT